MYMSNNVQAEKYEERERVFNKRMENIQKLNSNETRNSKLRGGSLSGEPSQEIIRVEGLEILFPYKPYEAQRAFIEAVVKACETRTNAMLESPTGTGKTLSLLCASLAWLEYHRQQCNTEVHSPKIIYF